MSGGRERQRHVRLLAGLEDDAEILDEDGHGRARCIVAGQNVRHAVLEHPRRAGAIADHFVEHLGIGADLDAESHRLGRRRDMHAGQQLVDHLDRGAGARRVAQSIDLLRHRFQHRLAAVEGCGRTGRHDRQFTGGGLGRATGNGRIEQHDIAAGQSLPECLGVVGRHGAAKHDDAARAHRLHGAVISEQHLLGLIGVDDRHEDDAAGCAKLARTAEAGGALVRQLLHGRRTHVVHANSMSGARQRPGHAAAHCSETDDANEVLHGALQACCSGWL